VLEEAVIKLYRKPVGSLVSSLYGMLAGAIVHRIWVSVGLQDDVLQASRAQRNCPARRGRPAAGKVARS
jgi:hypothetical protein